MTTSGFYNEKRNTLDVLAFGSSHAYASINPIEIWDKTGIQSYVLATSNQPIWITYYYMKEALKFQKPKVMILDVHMIVDYDKEYGTEAMNYTALNEMKFSKTKLMQYELVLLKKIEFIIILICLNITQGGKIFLKMTLI